MDTELHAMLSKLVGTWRTEGHVVGGDAAGERWTGHDVYEWFPGGQHLAHRADVTMSGQRTEGLEFFTGRDDGSLVFDQISFQSDGSVERARGSFDEQGRYHNDLDHVRATLTFVDADHLEALWEQKADGATWSDWMEVRFSRIAEPHIEIRSKDDHTV